MPTTNREVLDEVRKVCEIAESIMSLLTSCTFSRLEIHRTPVGDSPYSIVAGMLTYQSPDEDDLVCLEIYPDGTFERFSFTSEIRL